MRLNPILIFLGIAAVPALAKPTRYEVKDAAFRNLVQFTSDAPLERTVGTSHFVVGWLEIDPQALKSGIKGEFEVDTRAFEMGPDSKAARLREVLFNSAEFPGAFYKPDKLEMAADELVPGKTFTGRVSGMLTIRGVNRRHEMQIKATYHPQSEATGRRMSGNLLKMTATFDIALSDAKISVPENLGGLLAPNLRFVVDMVGTDVLPVSSP